MRKWLVKGFKKEEKKMKDRIEDFIGQVIDDVEELRKSNIDLKERLPLEIMALDSVANAFDIMQKDHYYG